MQKIMNKGIISTSKQIIAEHYYIIGLEYCWALTCFIYVDEDILEQELLDAAFGC